LPEGYHSGQAERDPESRFSKQFWIPAFAGMAALGAFARTSLYNEMMFVLLLLSVRSLASVPYMQGFEKLQSRDQLTFKTPDLAADNSA
jgi:hypothetical protein